MQSLENEKDPAEGWSKKGRVAWVSWSDEKGKLRSMAKVEAELSRPNSS